MHGNVACLLALLALTGGCRSPVELEQPLGYPCAPDAAASAEAQCPAGSRCGLEGRCHVIGEAAPYPCDGDEHCEGGWRCGSDHRCLDASGEALVPVLPGGTPVVTPLVPPLFGAPPSLLATTEYQGRIGCYALNVEAFAAVGVDGMLEIVHRVPQGTRDIPLDTPSERCQEAYNDPDLPLLPSRTERHPLGGKILIALAASQDRVSGLTTDGRLCEVGLDVHVDQAWSCELPVVPAGARALRTPARHQGGSSEWTLVAFDATSFGVQTGLNRAFHGPFQVHRGDGQPLAIHDLLVLEDDFTRRIQLFVGTDHGILTAWFDGDPASASFGRLTRPEVPGTWPLEDGVWSEPDWPKEAGTPWRRVPLTGPACAWGQFPFQEVVSWLGWMGEATSVGSGALLFRVEESDVWPGGGIRALPLEIVPERTMPPAQACEPVPLLMPGWTGSIRLRAPDGHASELLSFYWGERPGSLQFAPLEEGGVRVDGWLQQADGGVKAVSGLSRTAPGLPELSPMTSGMQGNFVQSAFLNRPHVRSQHSPTRALAANDLGQAWAWGSAQFGPDVSRVPLTPVLFAPLVMGDEVDFEARSPEIRVGGYTLEAGGDLTGTADGGISFRSTFDLDGVLTVLPGLRGVTLATTTLPSGLDVHVWIQFSEEEDTLNRVLAVLPAFSAPQPPFGANLVPTADGGTALLTSAADTLFAVDVTAALADPSRGQFTEDFDLSDFPRAEVVLVPLARSNITSIAPIPAQDGEYASGFLLAGHRVFRYHASNEIVWRSSEIPVLDGVPHEVWSTGDRARIGYTDGRVLSLPGRLQLAAPLPLEAGPALDYVQVCGQTYVLARFGLHRLVGPTADAKLAHWEPVALGPEVHKAAHPKRGYLGSTLFGGQKGLLFFDPAGRSFRIDQLGCQP